MPVILYLHFLFLVTLRTIRLCYQLEAKNDQTDNISHRAQLTEELQSKTREVLENRSQKKINIAPLMRLATSTLPALLKWQNKINMMLGSKITFHPSRAAFTPFLTLSRHGCHRSSFRGAGAAGPPARRPRDVRVDVLWLRKALHRQVQRQATRPTHAPGKGNNLLCRLGPR